MSFLAPAYLWGLAALSIPVLIHLIFQRRYRRVKWAAIEFLLVAVKKTKSRLKLENLLLLLLRLAILLFLALLFARFFVPGFGGFFPGSAAKRSVHLVLALDRSYSMGYVQGNATSFEKARLEARRRIDQLDPTKGDSVTLVTLEEDPAVWRGVRFLSEKDEALAALDAMTLSDSSTDVPALARRLLDISRDDKTALGGEPAHSNRRLLVLTDLTAHGWNQGGGKDSPFHKDLARVVAEYGPFELVNVGPAEKEPANLVVSDLSTSGKVAGVGLPVTFTAVITNESAERMSGVEAAIEVDGRRTYTHRDIEIEPRSEASVHFYHQFTTAGPHWAEVVAGGSNLPDRLEVDNRRRVVFEVKDEIPILLVDGDPTLDPYDRATYYLEQLFTNAGGSDRHTIMRAKVVREFPLGEDLGEFAAVVVANLRKIPGEVGRTRLATYVDGGGALVFFLGDLVEPESYNRELYASLAPPLFPGRIGKRFYGGTDLDETQIHPVLVPTDFEHPVLRWFANNRDLENLFKQVQTREFYRIERESSIESTVLVAFDDADRSPALVEYAYGEGRVFLFTTSADRRWSHLPYAPVFVPLIHELLLYAAHRDPTRKNLLVGAPYLGHYPYETRGTIRVRRPAPPGAGHPAEESPADDLVDEVRPESDRETGGIRVYYPRTDRAGVYTFEIPELSAGEDRSDERTDLVGVNVDPAEGNLARLGLATLSERFPGIPFERREEHSTDLAVGLELWRPFAWAVLALLVIESWVALSFGRYALQ